MTGPELLATTGGLFPPVDPEDGDAVERARHEAVAWQVDAGLDRLVEGQRGWTAGLTAPLLSCAGVETSPVGMDADEQRPVVTDDLAATGRLAAELRAANDCVTALAGEPPAMQAVVPGPYTLASLVEAPDRERGALVDALADWLAAELRICQSVETTLVLTPGLVASPPSEGLHERLPSALDVLADGTDGDVIVYPPGGAVTEKTYAFLMDAAVTALGVDLCADHERCRYLVNEYGTTDDLLLGIADATDSECESTATLRDRVAWWLSNTPAATFDRLYLSLSGPVRSLASESVEHKLSGLARVANESPD